MVGEFQYLDAIIVDTPILDKEVRENVKDVKSTEQRLGRAEAFSKYLTEPWKQVSLHAIGFNWYVHTAELSKQLAAIRRSISH